MKSVTLPSELERPGYKISKIKINIAADLEPVLVDLLVILLA